MLRKNGKRDLGNLCSVLQLLNSCEESSYFAMVMLNGGPACPEYQYLFFFPFVFIVSIFLFFFLFYTLVANMSYKLLRMRFFIITI